MCGERGREPPKFHKRPGSSPRVQGTPGLRDLAFPSRRFIPACAGNAPSLFEGSGFRSVHPRVCGERRWRQPLLHSSAGSSPRVRGTLKQVVNKGEIIRFIPACAGNASSQTPVRSNPAVHPRVCGERHSFFNRARKFFGSSPRVRGTRGHTPIPCALFRFIPACAGNASNYLCRQDLPAVHPRVCGERHLVHLYQGLSLGSSPRVRGTRAKASSRRAGSRFIPACAGNAFCSMV